MTSEFDHWLAFARKVYGAALDTSGVRGGDWQRWYGHPHRLRVRFADGTVREGVVAITKGPEPRFMLRRNSSSGGGVPLTGKDRVVAVQGRHGYEQIGVRT